jgi:tripeptidyl-peptidase-1
VSRVDKRSVDKDLFGVLPPILRPVTMSLDLLLGDMLSFCDVVVTPDCIKSMSRPNFI